MVRLAVLGLVVVLAGGCRELNPTYCAVHREDPDCLLTGVELLDAPDGPECTGDSECLPIEGRSLVCDVTAGRCVECVLDSTCPAMQFCGTDQRCHGCVMDDDCPSDVCLGDQTCAMVQNVIYAAATGTGTMCTSTEPCTLPTAVSQLTMARHIIKVIPVAQDVTDPPITISTSFGVKIIAKGVVYTPTGSGPAITASGANLEIVGLTIEDADAEGALCTNGNLTLQEVTITNAGDFGVRATTCNLTVKRSRISGSSPGAIYAGPAVHDIHNNILFDNGNGNLETGAIQIRNATGGRVAFNTVVRTTSRSGGQRVGGIYCTEASNGVFTVAQNIIASWGNSGRALGPGDTTVNCVFRENYQTQTLSDVKFTPDYHLTDQSPAGQVRDANTPAMQVDCSIQPTVYLDDIDGQARPFNNFCDRGADEYRP